MAYGHFKTIEEVARKFDIEVVNKMTFVKQEKINIEDILFSMLLNSIGENLGIFKKSEWQDIY